MSFERYRVQTFCERLVEARGLEDWNRKREEFQALKLDAQNVDDLQKMLCADAGDIYFKGLLSLCEGIQSISRGLYSWATVKLYYSLFYFLRCSLAAMGYAVVRNKSLYVLKIAERENPKKKSTKRFRNDHLGAINIYKDIFGDRDILQSNSIGGANPYEWLMERRNQVNYRERKFHEPDVGKLWEQIAKGIENDSLESLVWMYIKDKDYVYCFQEEHACLALPLKRAILTHKDILDEKIKIEIEDSRKELLKRVLNFRLNMTKYFESTLF